MARRLVVRAPLLALIALTTSFTEPVEPSLVREAPVLLRARWHTDSGFTYLVVEPVGVREDAELPMIVHLHGRGAAPIAPKRSIFGLRRPVRLVMPRGPLRFGNGYAWMPVSAHNGESKPLLSALDERTSMLANAVSVWRRNYRARGRPIVTGFSQGAIVATHLAIAEPRAASRAIVIAGWFPPSRMPRTSHGRAYPRISLLHGSDDHILEAERTRVIAEELRSRGVPVTFEVFEGVGHSAPASIHQRLRALLEEELRERSGDRS